MAESDVESARGAFQSAVAMNDPEWSPRAAYHLGELLWQVDDPAGAEAALWVAIQARHPEWSPAAEVVQGVICASRQDMAGGLRAYGAAIASRHPTHAARAWFNLGTLHQQRDEIELAVAAYRGAIEYRHPEIGPARPSTSALCCSPSSPGRAGRGRLPGGDQGSDPEQAQLGRQNLAAMPQLAADRRRGLRHDGVEEPKDLSVGRGKGSQRWTAWVRRERR